MSAAVPLGGRRGLLSVTRVYQTPQALQVDEIEGYDVTRRAVLLDEVVLVTYHRVFGWPLLLGLAVLLTLSAFVSALVAIGSARAGLLTLALTGLPCVTLAALRVALRLDVVTVYGVRSRASMQFWFAKRRAREVFLLVCRVARERQQRRGRPPAGTGRTEAQAAPQTRPAPLPQ